MKTLIAKATIAAESLKDESKGLRVMLTQFLRDRYEKQLGTQAGGSFGGRFEGLNDYHVCSDRLAMEMQMTQGSQGASVFRGWESCRPAFLPGRPS